MTERYNAIECEMGISTYASTHHEGFAAVSKARYSDFVVHEVNNRGDMARLESLQFEDKKDTDANLQANKKRKLDSENASTEKTKQDPAEFWTGAHTKLSEWVGAEVATPVVSMLKHWELQQPGEESLEGFEKNVTLPAIAEKDTRRNLHEWIRSCLKCARADTIDGRVRIWHVRFEKEMPNYRKFGNNNSNKKRNNKWPSDRPEFLRFVLYKENADTSVAIKEICRRLGGGGGRKVRVGYAGMKDKRGVTSQFCTLYKREPSEILGINQKSGGGGNTSQKGVSVFRVGNFEYVDQELRLGSLSGNRFDVVLRNVESGPTGKGNDRIQHTKECLEQAALSLRNHGFINYFGMQRFGKYYDTHKVGIAVLKGDFEGAVNLIMQPKSDEPQKFEHARAQWASRFDSLAKDASLEEKRKTESIAAKEALRGLGRFMTCEVSILKSLIHKPLDYKRGFGSIPKNLRLIFLHALQSYLWNHVASHRIETTGTSVVVGDLVLIDDKNAKEGGSGTSGLGGKTVKLVDENDVSSKKYFVTDLVLPLVGTKVQYPQNSSGALFDSLLEKEGLSKQNFSNVKDRELSLGGDYRKIICKPLDVDYEIRQYHDPLQPLLQTDLMQLNGIPVEEPTETEDSGKPVLLAMIIGFTLPASSYATIALRELMKRPTSSDYQRKLLLEGSCEHNIIDNNGEEQDCFKELTKEIK